MTGQRDLHRRGLIFLEARAALKIREQKSDRFLRKHLGQSGLAGQIMKHSLNGYPSCDNAWKTRCGVKGILRIRTPVASKTAFASAGATPSLGISAIALAPNGPVGSLV